MSQSPATRQQLLVQPDAGARYLRKLARGVGTAHTGAVEAATQDALSDKHAEQALEIAIRTIERERGTALEPELRAAVEALFLKDGKRAIARLKQHGIGTSLPPHEQDALEAIVELDGSRPTLAVPEGDAIDPKDESLGTWREPVKTFLEQISAVASAVGRVDLDGMHKGTAFVVKDGLILTNRHVLQEIATADKAGHWQFRGNATLTFDSNPNASRGRHFRIAEVVAAGPHAIDLWNVDFTKLDFALLACDVPGESPFPMPLPLESDADKIVEGRPIFTIGYPGNPGSGTYTDDVLERLFAHRYGVKRFAPGEIDRALGSTATADETVFHHDATTLGGNSGSCVVDFGNDGRLVVGLHFAGRPKTANYAHANARLRESLAAFELSWKDWILIEAAMKEEVDALVTALADSGCDAARERMPALLAALRSQLDERLTRTVLDKLRAYRCFEAIQTFATEAAKVAQGKLVVYVQRQLAQSKIELGRFDEAATVLDGLVQHMGSAVFGKEWSEVNGLLGRVHKQRFVQAVAGGEKGEKELRGAVAAYSRAFDQDPAWHGANIVALVARAERDRLAADTDRAHVWAQRLLDRLAERAESEWSPWDYASAGEAYLALGDSENVADRFARYWNMPNVDAFALAGTQRQLREIWQITSDSPDTFKASLLLHLEARKLTVARGGARYSAADLQRLATQLRNASPQAEATFGAGSAIPIERVLRLLNVARSVCRIADVDDPDRSGTGFLVRGRDFTPPRDGVLVLTNHHVLHGDEASDELLSDPDYHGSIHASRAIAEFHFWGGAPVTQKLKLLAVCCHSPRRECDFALASLSDAVPEDLALPLSTAPKPLGSRNVVDPRQRAKVIVVGHPAGRELSFSLSDNEVVDHELDDKDRPRPRRIHYRTPTAPGSSGSPVLHEKTLEVLGLHRSGRVKPLREDWPRTKHEESYEANEAVSLRSLLGT